MLITIVTAVVTNESSSNRPDASQCLRKDHVWLCMGVPQYVAQLDELASIKQSISDDCRQSSEYYLYLNHCERDQRAGHRFLDSMEKGW